MKKIEGKVARQIHFVNFAAMMPIWIFVGFIAGAALGIWLENWVVFWVGLVGSPLVFNYMVSSKRINNINAAYQYMSGAVTGKLKNADYYNTGEYGAIAVDAKNKEVSVISADQKFKFKEPFVFNSEKIRNYKSYAPGYSTWDSVGRTDAMTQIDMLNKNLKAKAKAHAESGIYIDLDDVSKPQIFVQMEYSEAEKWLLIFEKLLNGTLESQPTPMLFPQAQ